MALLSNVDKEHLMSGLNKKSILVNVLQSMPKTFASVAQIPATLRWLVRYKNCQMIWIWNWPVTKVNTNHCCLIVTWLPPWTQSILFQFLCYSTIITSAILTSRWMNSIKLPWLAHRHANFNKSHNLQPLFCVCVCVCVHVRAHFKSYEISYSTWPYRLIK